MPVELDREPFGEAVEIGLDVGEAHLPAREAAPFHLGGHAVDVQLPDFATLDLHALVVVGEGEGPLVRRAKLGRFIMELEPVVGPAAAATAALEARERGGYRLGRSGLRHRQYGIGETEHQAPILETDKAIGTMP